MAPSTISLGKVASTAPGLGALTTTTSLAAISDKENKDHLAALKVSGKWGLIMATVNLVYGYVMVAAYLPPDPRQEGWVLMRSPLPTYMLTVVYLAGVTWVGPKFMEGRSSLPGLRPVMVVYNAFQVLYSVWLVYMSGMGGWFGSYSLRCQPCDFSSNPKAMTMLHGSYWYYVSKFVDFFDTVFFVLNKKYEHISVLHVVHHSLMPISMWYGVRYQPGGNSTLMGFLNSIVHTVMYTYYLLAAMGPRVRPFLWWKKYLTTLQLVQFSAVMIHIIQLAFIDCPQVPARVSLWVFGNATMFLFLFSNFYKKSYMEKKTRKQQMVTSVVNSGSQNSLSASSGTCSGPDNVTRLRVTGSVAPKTMEVEVLEASMTSHLRAL